MEYIMIIALTLLVMAALLLAWGILGLVISLLYYFFAPDLPRRGQGPCAVCNLLQAIWDRMGNEGKTATLPNFVAAKVACQLQGCNLNLRVFGL
jgi:hypothetical protein